MLKLLFRFVLCVMLFWFFACNPKSQNRPEIMPVDTLNIEFAHGFSISYYADYKLVTVKNFRNTNAVETRYYLVKNAQTQTPADGQKIVVPLRTLATGSATLYEFLELVGEMNAVVAVTNADVAYNQKIRDGIAAQKIVDLGDALSINVEKVLTLQPAALMMSGYNATDTRADRIEKAGIPLVINNEWQESNVLGRAEWLKFVAAFFNKEATADSIFEEIVTRYNSIKDKALQIQNKPSVMSGANFRGTWYMPGGQSFMAQLFTDAGANYFYKNDKSSASLPLNFETVLKNFANSDCWLNCDYRNFTQLRAVDTKNMLFKPAQTNNVWNFNRRMVPNGANDFWESAVARPDLLLADLITILHPTLLPDYQLIYAKKLE